MPQPDSPNSLEFCVGIWPCSLLWEDELMSQFKKKIHSFEACDRIRILQENLCQFKNPAELWSNQDFLWNAFNWCQTKPWWRRVAKPFPSKLKLCLCQRSLDTAEWQSRIEQSFFSAWSPLRAVVWSPWYKPSQGFQQNTDIYSPFLGLSWPLLLFSSCTTFIELSYRRFIKREEAQTMLMKSLWLECDLRPYIGRGDQNVRSIRIANPALICEKFLWCVGAR